MPAESESVEGRTVSVESLRRIPPRFAIGLLGFAILALLPLQLSTFDQLTMIGAFYFVMFVVSWDYVSGYTGQMSFGHTFLFALGGYSSALLNLNFGLSPLVSIPVGVAVAALGGLLLGLASLRMRGNYLVLVTLVIPLILNQIFVVYSDIFGGSGGLRKPATVFELDSFASTTFLHYYLAFVLFVVVFGIAYVVTRSDTGTVFTAIREDQEAVAASGISTARYKLFAFTTSGMMGGLAGAVLVHSPVGSPAPDVLLAIPLMIQILLASIVGGLGTIVGPVAGGFLVYLLQNWLRSLDFTVPVVNLPITQINMFLFYIVMIVFLFYLPEGLVPRSIKTGRRLLARFRAPTGDVATDGGSPEPPLTQIRHGLHDDMKRTLDETTERRDETTDDDTIQRGTGRGDRRRDR